MDVRIMLSMNFLLLLALVVGLNGQTVYNCGSDFEIQSVRINDCDPNEETCVVPNGTNRTVIIDFTEGLKFEDMHVEASVKMFGQEFEITTYPSRMCDHWRCPVTLSDDFVSLNATATIETIIPGTADFKLKATYSWQGTQGVAYCIQTVFVVE